MPAVTFNNTQNVGFIVANTAAPRRNLSVSIPPGDAGDAIVVIATGNTGTSSISSNINGYTNFSSSTSAAAPGALSILYRISNGRETELSIKTDSAISDASFCAAVLRFKGAHRIVPIMATAGTGSSPNTAVDGVQISTIADPVVKPIGDNSILVSVICGSDGTAFLDGEQPPSQTLVTRANTANSRLMVSYQNKPTTNSYGVQVFANTSGNRRAVTFSVVPDTAAAGAFGGTYGGGITITRTTGHYLQYDPRVSVLAKKDEEIGEVGYRLATGSIGDGSGIEIGIYDVTNGYANAKLVGAQTINTLTQTSITTFRQTFNPPIKLTPGRRYSTGFRTNSATTVSASTAYLGNQILRVSSQNGSVALPSSWDFDSTTGDNWYNVFALTRNSRKVHVSSYKFFSNTISGTAHSSQFPLYAGVSRKIIVMGYAENQISTMDTATFDGQAMTLIANNTEQDDFCMWYYDVPDGTAAGNKTITMTTPQATSIASWHAWQLNRANTGMPRNSISFIALGLTNNISNTIFARTDSIVLASVASSSPARTYTWNNDIISDRQQLDETNQTTATADAFQYTEGTKTITATATGTEGNKYLGILSIDTIKSKNKIKSGFVG